LKAHCNHLEPSNERHPALTEERKRGSLGEEKKRRKKKKEENKIGKKKRKKERK
jgi:hypothetical protein